MAKLANAPVYFTIGQVRHNPLLSLETYIPAIQEAMRRSDYPDYRVSKVVTLVWAGSPTDSNPTPPTSEQASRYTFSNSDRTRAFILFPNSISFETTRYDTSVALIAEMMTGLRCVGDIVGGFSVPFGDGGNPSPSGEARDRVTWSSATLPTGSAHEERPEGAPRVDPEI